MQIKGTFEVKITAEPPFSEADGISLGRATLAKTFHGGFEGTSSGHMIGARNANVPTSAGYVAIERVAGTLAGLTGTFVLQHNGVMNRGTASLDCTVVPDSGTGELTGLSGRLAIDIVETQHYYTFDYELYRTRSSARFATSCIACWFASPASMSARSAAAIACAACVTAMYAQ